MLCFIAFQHLNSARYQFWWVVGWFFPCEGKDTLLTLQELGVPSLDRHLGFQDHCSMRSYKPGPIPAASRSHLPL